MDKHIKFYTLNWTFCSGITLGVLGSLANLAVPLIIKRVIDIKANPAQYFHADLLFLTFGIMLLAAIIGALSDYLISKSGDKRIAEIRLMVQSHLLSLPYSYFEDKESGKLASRVINDAMVIKSFMTVVIPSSLNSFLTVVGTLIILTILDWKLTVVIVISFLLLIFIAIPLGKINEQISIQSQQKLSDLSGESTESLRSVKAIKLNNAEHNVLTKFARETNSLYSLSKKADLVFAITGPLQTVVTLVVIISIILYGGYRVGQGTLTLGTLVSFLVYLFQVVDPINNLAGFYTNYFQAKGATQKITSIINEDLEREKGLPSVPQNLLNSSLTMENVSFSFKDTTILSNINMSFESGDKIAIVGPSGAGKTTIINIISRLYSVSSGSLKLGNKSAGLFDLYSWRNLFGVVTQENSILSGTIYHNLTFGLTKTPSVESIWKALNAAHLGEDVRRMKDQLNTQVGENGATLSGGQRQRLQIARAYLKESPFLILDEATSNLDPDSEKSVSTALSNIMRNKTIIMVAHRLSTVTDADKIYFLNHHTVVGCGTHSELIKTVPEYQRFVNEQMISNS